MSVSSRIASICTLSLAFALTAHAQIVRFATTQGDIDVQLLPEAAPRTVANFLNYVNRGAYSNTFFHRSVANFVVQAGGFKWQNSQVADIPQDAPVRNEYNLSNIRGTIAMAKLGTGPDTATNQWFFSLGDNSANLNNQNGGFTVFGRITGSEGLEVMDKIGAVRTYNLGEPFDAIPLVNYSTGNPGEQNLVIVKTITVLSGFPTVAPNGVLTASGFGGFASAAPGSYIEIYGTSLLPEGTPSRQWAGADFNGSSAPTTLDGVSVSIGGRAAYVNYISPGQINVQVPGNVPAGSTLNVIVNSKGLTTAAVPLQIRARAPGLLAPAAFKPADKQYVVAVRPNGTFVSNGTIAGIPAAPAVPGETVTFYGTGFGSVRNGAIGGQIASGLAPLIDPVEVKLDGVSAEVTYAGLTPGLVGVYQFNVRIPDNVPDGDLTLTLTIGGEPLVSQNLFLSVKR